MVPSETTTLILDFDNTFIGGETLDILAEQLDSQTADRVAALTEQAMNGQIGFAQALSRRVACLNFRREQVIRVTEQLRQRISPSFLMYRDILQAHAASIYIVSGGFREIIVPIVADFSIAANHVLANTFCWQDEKIIGVDENYVLAKDGGKAQLLASLSLPNPLIMVGDGMTDYEVYAKGLADEFFAYTEQVKRDAVLAKATQQAASIDVVLKAIGWLT